MLWEFLPKGLKDIFEVVNVENGPITFDVWLDEKREKSELVVPGFLLRCLSFKPCLSRVPRKRSLPSGVPSLNSRLYICHSFLPPIPGAFSRVSRTYSTAISSSAILA